MNPNSKHLCSFLIQKFIISTFMYSKHPYSMTSLGLYLTKKSINKAEVARRTGISKSRLSQLSSNETTKLRADELYLIALAIDVDPCEVLTEVCGDVELKN